MVYNQKISGLCGPYAFLLAMNHLGKNIPEQWTQQFLPKGFASTDFGIRKCIEQGLIKGGFPILTVKQAEYHIRRGEYIIVATSTLNFESVRNYPFIQDFKGNKRHFFCIIGDEGEYFRIQDSQGESFSDKGTWKMLKKDFNKLLYPRTIK